MPGTVITKCSFSVVNNGVSPLGPRPIIIVRVAGFVSATAPAALCLGSSWQLVFVLKEFSICTGINHALSNKLPACLDLVDLVGQCLSWKSLSGNLP